MASVDLVTVGSLIVEITPTLAGESMETAHQYTLVAGGAAANMVFALARLGVTVRLITAVGDDEFGTLAANEMAAFGVDTGSIKRVAGQLTPASFCSVDRKGRKQFRFYRVPGYCSPLEALRHDDFQPAADCRVFDFSEGSIRDDALRPLVFQTARLARSAGAVVVYAANLRRGSWKMTDAEVQAAEREAVSLADIVQLNDEEVAFITGMPVAEGVDVLRDLGPRVVIVTRGGDGDITVRVGEEETMVPPYRVPVIYDVGAGDTFHAGLMAAALQHEFPAMSLSDWSEAVRFAAATAAIRVSTSADPHDLPTSDQVRGWMSEVDKSENVAVRKQG